MSAMRIHLDHDHLPTVRLNWLLRWAARHSPATNRDDRAFQAEATEAVRRTVEREPDDDPRAWLDTWAKGEGER